MQLSQSRISQPVGVIIAGGQARRMGGGDKGLLNLAGRPLLQHVIDRLSPQVAAVALNMNGDETRVRDYGLPVLADEFHDHGPLAGILAGLDWAAHQGAQSMVSAAADTPFFPCDLVPHLLLAAENSPAGLAIAATDRVHPLFGVWPVALRDDLRAALRQGMRKMQLFTQQNQAAIARFPTGRGIDPFFNINTPDDLEFAASMTQGTAPRGQ